MDKLRGGVQTAGARVAPVPARWRPRRLPAGLAVAGAVTLPHPTLPSLGLSIRTGRERQHNDRTLANGEGWSTGWPASGTCTGAGPHSMFGYPPKAGPGHLGMLVQSAPHADPDCAPQFGPDHLETRCKACGEQQTAMFTSSCVPFQEEGGAGARPRGAATAPEEGPVRL